MCGFLCIMEALAISGYVTFADQDGKTQAICRDASAANLTICSGTDYAKLSLLTGLRELRLDFSTEYMRHLPLWQIDGFGYIYLIHILSMDRKRRLAAFHEFIRLGNGFPFG